MIMKNLYYILAFTVFGFSTGSFAGALDAALETSASGMRAQSERIKIVTENIANEDTTGINPNEEPYRRKTIYFEEVKDGKTKANLVKVKKIGRDNSTFKLIYLPNHPAANEEGYVRMPNVDKSLESMDLRDAQRSYEANISAIETTKQINERTLDLMR
jgi:flagellar basal-body rod protein FlgC